VYVNRLDAYANNLARADGEARRRVEVSPVGLQRLEPAPQYFKVTGCVRLRGEVFLDQRELVTVERTEQVTDQFVVHGCPPSSRISFCRQARLSFTSAA
jgi:hypothetical protein